MRCCPVRAMKLVCCLVMWCDVPWASPKSPAPRRRLRAAPRAGSGTTCAAVGLPDSCSRSRGRRQLLRGRHRGEHVPAGSARSVTSFYLFLVIWPFRTSARCRRRAWQGLSGLQFCVRTLRCRGEGRRAGCAGGGGADGGVRGGRGAGGRSGACKPHLPHHLHGHGEQVTCDL